MRAGSPPPETPSIGALEAALPSHSEIVVAEPARGPWRGGTIVSISTTAGDVAEREAEMRAMPPSERKRVGASITKTVRDVVTSPAVAGLNPTNDKAFLGDLRLLAVLHPVDGDRVLVDAGIARLARVMPGEGRDEAEWPHLRAVGAGGGLTTSRTIETQAEFIRRYCLKHGLTPKPAAPQGGGAEFLSVEVL